MLIYDPISGEFWSGPKVLTARDGQGYVRVRYQGRAVRAHRLAWLFTYGVWPAADIDHINGVPDDNRLCNLRLASRSQNIARKRYLKPKKHGLPRGVGIHPDAGRSRRFKATITVECKPIHLGWFASADEAHAAYCDAAIRLRGKFARLE